MRWEGKELKSIFQCKVMGSDAINFGGLLCPNSEKGEGSYRRAVIEHDLEKRSEYLDIENSLNGKRKGYQRKTS